MSHTREAFAVTLKCSLEGVQTLIGGVSASGEWVDGREGGSLREVEGNSDVSSPANSKRKKTETRRPRRPSDVSKNVKPKTCSMNTCIVFWGTFLNMIMINTPVSPIFLERLTFYVK